MTDLQAWKNCPWRDSNCRSLASEATALPAVQQPLPITINFCQAFKKARAGAQARSSSSSNGHLLQRDRYQLEMWSFFSTNMWAEPLTLLCLHTSTWKTSIWWRNIGSNGILAEAQKLTAVGWVHLKVMITFDIYWWVAQHRGWVWASHPPAPGSSLCKPKVLFMVLILLRFVNCTGKKEV